MNARLVLAIACGEAGEARRTGIMSTMVELMLSLLSFPGAGLLGHIPRESSSKSRQPHLCLHATSRLPARALELACKRRS